jgi:hypothetical protein
VSVLDGAADVVTEVSLPCHFLLAAF